MLNRGDLVATQPTKAESHNCVKYLVLDVKEQTLLAAPVTTKPCGTPEFCSKIAESDIEAEGNVGVGFAQIDQIVSLTPDACSRIGKVKSAELEEALRLFTKYAGSLHFDSVHKHTEPKTVPASGKVLDETDLFALLDASLDMWLTAGRFSDAFEAKFPSKLGRKSCALVNSGSSANLLAVSALTSKKLANKRLQPGDEVITVASAFPTTVAPIIQNHLAPVFIDAEMGTYNFDAEMLEKAVSKKTKAIFMAHTLGNPFDLNKAKEVAESHNLWFIEDNCDALGAQYDNKLTGTFGDEATFSFYPAHHITMGEGGAVLTDDAQIYRVLCSLRDWGRDCWCPTGKDNTCQKRFDWKLGTLPEGYDHKYTYSHLGYNLKATDMQAAIGLSQLEKLDAFVAQRRRNFNYLYEGFQKRGFDSYFELPTWLPKANPSWFGFPLTIKKKTGFNRTKLLRYLDQKGVGTRLLFAGNILRQPVFVENSFDFRIVGKMENADRICEDTFWIGVWPGLSTKHIEYVLDSFSSFLDQKKA